MLNDETVSTISIDHVLNEEQLIRATFVYSGEIEPLFAMGQEVAAGAVLFRLTREHRPGEYLGRHAHSGWGHPHAARIHRFSHPTGIRGAIAQIFAWVSLTPGGLLRDEAGRVLSPND